MGPDRNLVIRFLSGNVPQEPPANIAYGNYLIGRIAGMTLPDGLNLPPPEGRDKWEKATTDKKAIRDQLVKSFDFVKKGIASMPDSSLEKMVDFSGPKVSTRTVLMILLTHVHEHLGQFIAYARTARVVPPWAGGRGTQKQGRSETAGLDANASDLQPIARECQAADR